MSKVVKLLQACLDSYAAARGSAFTAEEGQALLDRLTPVAEAAVKYEKSVDRLVKTSKKQEKAGYKATRQMLKGTEEQRKAQVQKVRGDPQRAGYSNGVDVLRPTRQRPTGLGGAMPDRPRTDRHRRRIEPLFDPDKRLEAPVSSKRRQGTIVIPRVPVKRPSQRRV